MKKFVFIVVVILNCCLHSLPSKAGNPDKYAGFKNKKGSFYFYWGYNRSTFSPSDIHFSGPNYDFTVYGVKASDRPSDFGTVYFKPTEFSIPQYNYRIGYYITNRFGISLGMDHMKYVLDANQIAKVSGVVNPAASVKYAGNYLNKPTKLTQDFLMFEHTNGFNFLSLEAEYLQPLFSVHHELFSLNWNTGLGGVFLIPKTDVRVFGDGLDNRFHLAGYSLALKTGPRLEYKHKFFLAVEYKTGYVSLPDILIKNDSPERADQNIYFYEYYIVAGLNFKIHFKKEKIMPTSN